MSILVLQLNTYDPALRNDARMREMRFEADASLVASLLNDGLYLAVATLEGDDLEEAWCATQNGYDVDSWSRQSPRGIVPLGEGTIQTPDGRFGYRSSMTGDLMVRDGKVHIAVSVGFRELDLDLPATVPVVGGGTLDPSAPSTPAGRI